jgi:hypothetical protein
MKTFHLFFGSTLIILSALLLPKTPIYTLEEALKKGLVEMQSLQMDADDELHLQVRNLTKRKDFKVRFTSGLQFSSQDTSEQDQVLLYNRTFLVKAGKQINPGFATFCTQASKRGAGSGSTFLLKEKPSAELSQLAQYLSKYRDSEHTLQSAVWIISDDHDLRGLHHDDPQKRLALLKYMSQLTGKPIPGYTVRYEMPRAGEVAFSAKAISIHSEHKFRLEEDAKISCSIFNEAGEEVQKVFENMQQRRGYNRFGVTLEAKDLPKGKYVSRVFKDGKLLEEIWVES